MYARYALIAGIRAAHEAALERSKELIPRVRFAGDTEIPNARANDKCTRPAAMLTKCPSLCIPQCHFGVTNENEPHI